MDQQNLSPEQQERMEKLARVRDYQHQREDWKRDRVRWRERMAFLKGLWESMKKFKMKTTGDVGCDESVVEAWGDWRILDKPTCLIPCPPEPGYESGPRLPATRLELSEVEAKCYALARERVDSDAGFCSGRTDQDGRIDVRLKIKYFNEVVFELRKYAASEEEDSWVEALTMWRAEHMSSWSIGCVSEVRALGESLASNFAEMTDLQIGSYVWLRWCQMTGSHRMKRILQEMKADNKLVA